MTLKAGKGMREGGAGWGHRVGGGAYMFLPPQPKILYETLTRYLSWDYKRGQLLLKCLAPDFFLANVFARTLGYGMWLKQVESVNKTTYTCTLVIDNTWCVVIVHSNSFEQLPKRRYFQHVPPP